MAKYIALSGKDDSLERALRAKRGWRASYAAALKDAMLGLKHGWPMADIVRLENGEAQLVAVIDSRGRVHDPIDAVLTL